MLVETVGADMAQNTYSLPSIGASGGILLAASSWFFQLDNPHVSANSISVTLTMLADNRKWSLTRVYGSQSDQEKVILGNTCYQNGSY
jgi:hypothetical protein